MRIKRLIIGVLFCILMMTGGCSKSDTLILEKIQSAFPDDVQNDGIYHAEVFKDRLLVFYKRNNGLGAGFFKQKSDHWYWVTGAGYPSLNPDDGLSAMYSNRKEISLYFSYGVITDPDIMEVRSSENKAKMIQTADGTRIWFIAYESLLGQDGSLPPISGISKDGDEIITIQ